MRRCVQRKDAAGFVADEIGDDVFDSGVKRLGDNIPSHFSSLPTHTMSTIEEDDDVSSADTDEIFVAIPAIAFPPIEPPTSAPVNSVKFKIPPTNCLSQPNCHGATFSGTATKLSGSSNRAATPHLTGSTPAYSGNISGITAAMTGKLPTRTARLLLHLSVSL
jgi:hypothetical protein